MDSGIPSVEYSTQMWCGGVGVFLTSRHCVVRGIVENVTPPYATPVLLHRTGWGARCRFMTVPYLSQRYETASSGFSVTRVGFVDVDAGRYSVMRCCTILSDVRFCANQLWLHLSLLVLH